MFAFLFLFLFFFPVLHCLHNGKGLTPPMGWRSWNLFGANVNQDLIQQQMNGLVSRSRLVDGVPTSLLDLGYSDIGLDDAWQKCGKFGPKRYTYHDEEGKPVVNTDLFPSLENMTTYAHKLGLTAGWYANNCICHDHCSDLACYQGDAKALVDFGFDSVKLDYCGLQKDLDIWADSFESLGKSILIENCHWGHTIPNATWCPWNYYRTSQDVRASYESVLYNLMSTVPLAKQNLSTPGCWAYPDMLEVGCAHGPGGASDPGLTFHESRTHFGAWCIVSSPLILSHDTTNVSISDFIWPIISNKEAIAVNQAWAGESGTLFLSSSNTVNISIGGISVGSWQQWSKQVGDTETAVLLINNDVHPQDVILNFADIPSFFNNVANTTYMVYDIWNHDKVGSFFGSFTAIQIASHDSVFLRVSF